MEALYDSLLTAYKNGTFQEELSRLPAKLPPFEKENMHFVPYPAVTDPQFYEVLSSKKEFRDIQGNHQTIEYDYDNEVSNRCNEMTFKLSPHQIFVKRFLSPSTPYNGLLMYHSVGVGKTCSAISIAEQYIGLYNKRVLVILSSTLKDNFKKQIFDITKYNMERNVANLCTGVKYPEMVVDRLMLKTDVFEKRITKLINERYQFMGFKELVEFMRKVRTRAEKNERDASKHTRRYKEKLQEIFSDRLIIIDEAHNLRMPSETGKKQISAAFLELLNVVHNTKLVLMTATPMFNDPREVVWLVNLLLTNDKRPLLKVADLFDQAGVLTKQGKRLLNDACKGYVSYMRGENPFSFPFRLYPADKHVIKTFPSVDIKGKRIPKAQRLQQLTLVGSELSAKQILAYEELLPTSADPEKYDEDEADEEVPNDVQNMLQLCNIVYPVANVRRCFGKKGFDECFSKIKGARGVRYEYRTQAQFLDFKNVGQYAPKLKRIVDYVSKAEGIVFVYSQYYYSGIIPLALALEHVGFNKLGGNIGEKLDVTQKAKLINEKRPNYVILSRDSDLSPNNDKEVALAKSSENLEGEIIKVIIVSKIGTEGIDLKRIREIHLLDPWYNLNRTEQIIGRGVRTCSHIDLPKEKRNTSIYLHATTMPDDDIESMDLRVYRIAESKQKNIAMVEDVLKGSSIDCHFNKPNIHFPKSTLNISFDIRTSQGEVVKDYSVGDVITTPVACTFKQGNNVDDSTYNIDIIQDEVEIYKQYIANIFKRTERNTYLELWDMLTDLYKSIDEDILKYALIDMIEEPYLFNGVRNKRGHLIYAGDKYVFVPDTLSTNMNHKARLPLDVLKERQPQKEKVEQVIPEVHASEAMDHITKEIQRIEMHVPKAYGVQILDSIIDRLSLDQLIALLLFLNSNAQHPLKDDVRSSVSKADFTFGEEGKIKGFYNHIDGDFYCLKGETFKKCTALDLAKVMKHVNDIKSKLILAHGDNVKGFVQHKDGVAKFKVRDGNTSGYVCYQTHSLQVDELKDRIKNMDANAFDPTAKLSKPRLCEIYEAIMRKQGKVMRPFLKAHSSK